jgi:hypothetical protein
LDAGWLPKAVDLCMNSAAAYKAAFMLADNAWDERRLLDLCTARYALLECLLGQLGGKMGAAEMRDVLDRASAGPFHHQTIDAALAAALICDRGLSLMIGADLRILSSNARSPAQVPRSPCASIPRGQPMAQAAGACT